MWKALKDHPIESVYALLYLPELIKDFSFPGHPFLIGNQVIWDWQCDQTWYSKATHWMHISPDGWRDIITDPPNPESSSILITKGYTEITVSNAVYPTIPEHIETHKIRMWKPIPCPPGYKELAQAKDAELNSPPTFFYELSEYDRG